jgi:hypothetical protein
MHMYLFELIVFFSNALCLIFLFWSLLDLQVATWRSSPLYVGCYDVAAPIKGTILGAYSDNIIFELMFYLFMVMHIVDASLVLFEVSVFRFSILVHILTP